MQIVKSLLKKALGVDPHSHVRPLSNLVYVGSKYHGYHVPANFLTKNSICYCIGAGEDISFDTELKIMFDSKVFIFDPAPEGKNHFKQLVDCTAKGEQLTIGDAEPFTYRINATQLSEITYVDKGVWDQDTVLKFYDPGIENYASHSVELFKDSKNFIEAPVDRLKNFMKKFNHQHIDLVKMEIEGAEYTVINTIVEDKLDVKVILVEYDEVFHSKGMSYLFRIKESSDKLRKAGYVIAHSTNYFKKLFIREDVYNQLKGKK